MWYFWVILHQAVKMGKHDEKSEQPQMVYQKQLDIYYRNVFHPIKYHLLYKSDVIW